MNIGLEDPTCSIENIAQAIEELALCHVDIETDFNQGLEREDEIGLDYLD